MDNLNVYINCPFDKKFEQYYSSILFTIIFLGYEPRSTLCNTDSSIPRLDKILALIKECDISVHDISYAKAVKKKEYYRLNMAFELGMDYCYKKSINDSKKFIIIASDEHDYKRALSDMSAIDIQHYTNYVKLIDRIINWFKNNLDYYNDLTNNQIIAIYETIFVKELYERYGADYDIYKIPLSDLKGIIKHIKK